MDDVRRTLSRERRFAARAVRHPRVIATRAKRIVSARTLYLERNHDTDKTLMLVGSGRSGSTWLGEILVEIFACRMIFEPLHRHRVPLARAVPWGYFAEPGDSDPDLAAVMGRIVSGRVRGWATDIYNTRRFPRRRLVKDIRATNLLPWLHARFPEVPIVYLLRHPVPAAWSATELGWDPSLGEFLGQRRLVDGPLAPWREVIAGHDAGGDIFESHVLRWCLENVVPIGWLAPGSVHVVFYEDLVEDPAGELGRLARYLERFTAGGWAFDPATPLALDRRSQADWRRPPALPSGRGIESWLAAVPARRVTGAVALVKEFGLDRLYDASPRPRVGPDEVLIGGQRPPQAEVPGSGSESSNSR